MHCEDFPADSIMIKKDSKRNFNDIIYPQAIEIATDTIEF